MYWTIECAAGHVKLTRWCQGWIERIAEIYRLNEARLTHYDPGLKRQAPAFDAMQAALMDALDRLFADAREELACLAMWSDPRADAGACRPRHGTSEGVPSVADLSSRSGSQGIGAGDSQAVVLKLAVLQGPGHVGSGCAYSAPGYRTLTNLGGLPMERPGFVGYAESLQDRRCQRPRPGTPGHGRRPEPCGDAL